MPRTCAYLSSFKSLLNGKSRREVMATGVALALAAPFSSAAASAIPVDDAEDWPEFHRWLLDALALDEHYKASDDDLDLSATRKREAHQSEETYRLDTIAEAMAARPIKTERQLAMLVTFAVWVAKRKKFGDFDLTTIDCDGWIADRMNYRLLLELAPRAAQVLPEVPFNFEVEA